jgi:benzoylformate decarboxylase
VPPADSSKSHRLDTSDTNDVVQTADSSVASASFAVLRARGMTRLFANPGSTEIPLLRHLPEDFEFVLALHEGSVVGMATGQAIASGAPAAVLLHTTAGLGNAIGALATARVNRAPLVVIVGQQDRRHLALEPFLAGHLEGLGGAYPVWVNQPLRASDVPGALARAHGEAVAGGGPALIIVPMDDWGAPVEAGPIAAPVQLEVGRGAQAGAIDELTALLVATQRPVVVAGAGADDERCWRALEHLAEILDCSVWQEAFGARAGFPQDHPRFAGHLPPARSRLRLALSSHDAVLVVGAPAFRLYPYEDGPLLDPGTRLAVVTAWADEALHSPADLAVVAYPAEVIERVVAQLTPRPPAKGSRTKARGPGPIVLEPAADGAPLSDVDVLVALRDRLPDDAIVLEEAPSAKPMLHRLIPARRPLGFVSAAMGGLGFGVPGAAGLRLAAPDRPVVAVLGDGSSLYGIQGLWSAAHYGIGVCYVVFANGRYAVMDQIAGVGQTPWPAFDEVTLAGLAESLGCEAVRVSTRAELEAAFDEILPTLRERRSPVLVEIAVAPPIGRIADGSTA